METPDRSSPFFTPYAARFVAELREHAAAGDTASVVELASTRRPALLRRALATAIMSESWTAAEKSAMATARDDR